MSSLTFTERKLLGDLLKMDGGYVSDLSDASLADLLQSEVGRDIHSEAYTRLGTSKAKKLREFWHVESDSVVAKALNALLDYEQLRDASNPLLSQARLIAERLKDSKAAGGESPMRVSDEAIKRIWKPNRLRIFLSHKATKKVETSKVKEALEACGLTAFVAHEDIEPDEEWQREIENALFSMDALVALMSDDFHDSNWTDQEVGVAMGRGVPMLAVRLGMNPYGLMGKKQGIGGCSWDKPMEMALKIFRVLYKRLADTRPLFDAAIAIYRESGSFAESARNVENLLTVFETLSADQVEAVLSAYKSNVQNKHSWDGRDKLLPLLKKWTGKSWKVEDDLLVLDEDDDD